MASARALALEAARRLRSSPGLAGLTSGERQRFARDLSRIESALADDDPYAFAQATPADFQRQLSGGGAPAPANSTSPPPQAPPAPVASTAAIGARAAEALAAVDFPGFVAGLVSGTFQAIVDANAQQLRDYAALVASISQTVEDFSRDNVSDEQVRAYLLGRHPGELSQNVPPPGQPGAVTLVPRDDAEESPAWLEEYGLAGESLTAELVEGPLLDAARVAVGEERMQTLATMVLMGVSRVVVNDGDIRARLQFHASARDRTAAEAASASSLQGAGIGARVIQTQSAATMMVSTLKANAQAEANIKADLMGEVRISFRTETFPLERFADSAALTLINRHARWQSPEKAAAAPAPAPTTTPEGAPVNGAPSPSGTRGAP